MKRFFVDSNIFLRFFAHDDVQQADTAEKLLMSAKQGEIELFCGPPVFFEVAWVLHSTFRLPHAEILDILESMLSIPNFTVFDAYIITKAIALARKKSLAFADGYIAATALEKGIGVATFNCAHFRKAGVQIYQVSTHDHLHSV
ncbi:MAG: PIN domain-containing protein [Desulfovibrio sp.]|jgi:predicted nucleic acid-binding protein|nr:PIN domain-containing protein [Desulfovibrio sp.]